MNHADLPATIRTIIAEQLGLDAGEVKPQHKLMEDLGADSLDAVEIAMALEESFSTGFPDEEIEPKLKGSVDELTRYVAGKVRQ